MTSTAQACAMASTMSTPGITGTSGKWPVNCGSLTVTFFRTRASVQSSLISRTRSIKRNGYR